MQGLITAAARYTAGLAGRPSTTHLEAGQSIAGPYSDPLVRVLQQFNQTLNSLQKGGGGWREGGMEGWMERRVEGGRKREHIINS